MTEPHQTLVFLLRGINVGGHKKVPMAELRALAADLGFEAPRTLIQSGNLVCATSSPPVHAQDALEEALAKHFGFAVEVVVRTAHAWLELAAGGPFPDAESARPKLLHLGLARRPALPNAEQTLSAYVRGEERVSVQGDVIWIDYAAGAGNSKITPRVLDRSLGTVVTCRNWLTVQKLAALLSEAP